MGRDLIGGTSAAVIKYNLKRSIVICRNVVSGAHYHFVSKMTSLTAYISAALVMIIFVSLFVTLFLFLPMLIYPLGERHSAPTQLNELTLFGHSVLHSTKSLIVF